MPTPVGPAPRDPNDPDLWGEWDDDEAAWDEPAYQRRFPVWVVVMGVIALVAFVAVYVLA